MLHRRTPILLLLAVRAMLGQGSGNPAISSGGITSAAGATLAQGCRFSIAGTHLGPGDDADERTAVRAPSPPYGTSLAGVSVRVSQGGNSISAYVLYAWTSEVEAILPSTAPLGEALVIVTYNGRSSAAAPVRIVQAGFGILSVGTTRAAPAQPGQTATLRGTGLGPIEGPDNVSPGAIPLATPVEVFVGGKPVAAILSAGRAGDLPAIDEIVFLVPDDVPDGCHVPVQVRTGGEIYSNILSMAIDAQGAACTDRLSPFARTVLTGGRVGLVELLRLHLRAVLKEGQPAEEYPPIDLGEAAFFQASPDDPGLNPLYARPPLGLCTGAPPMSVLMALLLPGAYGRTLDAGPLITVSGGAGEITLRPQNGFPGEYYGLLGGRDVLKDNSPTLPPFLTGGSYTLFGRGGRDVGGFLGQVEQAPALTWINRDAILDVDRGAGLTIEWTGGDPANQVAIIFGGASASTSGGGFLCVADLAAGSFTVPPAVLATVPPISRQAAMGGFVMIGAVPTGEPTHRIAPDGIDLGYIVNTTVYVRQVGFR